MKLMGNYLAKQTQQILKDRGERLVHCYGSKDGDIPINPPVKASDFSCPFCGTSEFILALREDKTRRWMCGLNCSPSKPVITESNTKVDPLSRNKLLWRLFCERSGIGDVHWDVSFDKVEQSPGKIDYLRKFAAKPQGIILMHGKPGTGKTYCCMGLCELYLRSDSSIIFLTHKSMADKWLSSFRDETNQVFHRKLEDVSLLVIDDFGTGEPTPSFLAFFMDIINSRMQWTTKGTVITTNLDAEALSKFCGNALSDRLRTGQEFIFTGSSKRTKVVL